MGLFEFWPYSLGELWCCKDDIVWVKQISYCKDVVIMFLIYYVAIDDGIAIDDGVENNDFTLSLSLSSLPVASLVQSSDPETVAPENKYQ